MYSFSWILYIYICKYRRILLYQIRTVYLLLASVHGDTRRETQFFLCWPQPQRAAHLVMFKISIHLCRSRPEKLNCNGRKLNSMPPLSDLNWIFFKILKFSGPSLLGMTSSTLRPYFLSGELLWQWWLSYPLRTSVKLHPMTMHLNS